MTTQLTMPFATSDRDSYEAADFIRGASNLAAIELVEIWPNWPQNIVLLHGPKGAGKTHLAHLFAAHSQAAFLTTSRIGTCPADQLITGNHQWVLDGVEQVTDDSALAQLLNHIRARGDYLLITANSPAGQLPIALPDLRSRLLALPSIALGAPDDALLIGVLAKQFADRQLRITPEVLKFAAQQLERSYEAVQQFACAMDDLSLERGRAITLTLVRDAFKNPPFAYTEDLQRPIDAL